MGLFDRIKRHIGACVLVLVAGYSLVYAIAFVRIYFMEHPYKVASAWAFDAIPAGSRIVAPHWDDKVPVSLPGKESSRFQMEGRDFELPVYERDTPQILQLILRKMSAADYIAFATPRTPDSIPRIPEEYPRTSALIKLLWAEKLGFKLAKTVKNRPSFLGITFNDDLADESFSVYDHPKVTFFQNVERLSVEELTARVMNPEPFEPLPTVNEILLMDEGGWLPKHKLWNPVWGVFVKTIALAQIFGLSMWVLFHSLCSRLPDRGLGVSGVIALGVGTAVAWGASRLGILPFSGVAGRFIVLIFVVAAAIRLVLRSEVRASTWRVFKTHGMWMLLSVVVGVILVSIMRSGDPSFFTLGDRVEWAYLSYFAKNEALPAVDVLYPGQTMPSMWFDRFMSGWFLKTADVPAPLILRTSFLVMGGALSGLLYTLVTSMRAKPRLAFVLVLMAFVPCAYVLHAVRDSTNESLLGGKLAQESPERSGFIAWAAKHMDTAPLVVEACDGDVVRGIAALAGLPAFAQPADEGASPTALCSTTSAQYAFDTMMKFELTLFVTPSAASALGASAGERLSGFIGRPDLFSKIYDDGSVAVFTPVFSDFFKKYPAVS